MAKFAATGAENLIFSDKTSACSIDMTPIHIHLMYSNTIFTKGCVNQ